jgi:hypothetical protein
MRGSQLQYITFRIARILNLAIFSYSEKKYNFLGTGSVSTLRWKGGEHLLNWSWQLELFSVTGSVAENNSYFQT